MSIFRLSRTELTNKVNNLQDQIDEIRSVLKTFGIRKIHPGYLVKLSPETNTELDKVLSEKLKEIYGGEL